MTHALLIAMLTMSVAALRDTTAGAQAIASERVALDASAATAETPQEWYALGRAFYESNRYHESIAAYERSLQLRADAHPDGAWHIARGYAQLGNRKQALRWLGHAQQLGFRDDKAMRDEPAFRKYHDDPNFRALVTPASCASCRDSFNPPHSRASVRRGFQNGSLRVINQASMISLRPPPESPPVLLSRATSPYRSLSTNPRSGVPPMLLSAVTIVRTVPADATIAVVTVTLVARLAAAVPAGTARS